MKRLSITFMTAVFIFAGTHVYAQSPGNSGRPNQRAFEKANENAAFRRQNFKGADMIDPQAEQAENARRRTEQLNKKLKADQKKAEKAAQNAKRIAEKKKKAAEKAAAKAAKAAKKKGERL